MHLIILLSSLKFPFGHCETHLPLYSYKFLSEQLFIQSLLPSINLFEYNGKCISECPNEEYFDEEDNIIKCKCELEKCLTCPTVALNNKLCTKCNDNYYPMENDPLNLGEYINCYNETPKGYYLDTQFSIFKKCYYTCDSCEIGGNNNLHNCVKCNAEYNFEIHINN